MSSILCGSYQPCIQGGTFNVNTMNQATRPTGFEKLMQAIFPNAFYNSDDRPDPPKCHEDTRIAVIDNIMQWVTGSIDADTLMVWFYGPAGAGKTAIARTVAEICQARSPLLASFLFLRSDSKRNKMAPLVANIAYGVARVIPDARAHIEAIIEADPLIFSYSVEDQFIMLVLEPLRLHADEYGHDFPHLIIIDGLDECLHKDAQTNLIQSLSSSVARYRLPLKFLIVSRPEDNIKRAFELARQVSPVCRIELNDDFAPDDDIRRFLTAKFRDINETHPSRSRLPASWPTEGQIETLVRKASGQFIYASLAMRFVDSIHHSPRRRLDIVLEIRPPIDHDLPFAELDALYYFIFSCSENPGLVQHILGVSDALQLIDGIDDAKMVEYVLGLEDGDVSIQLNALRSLVEIREDADENMDRIVFYHSSFLDFLNTSERSKKYFIDASISHSLITRWTLQVFSDNDSSMCYKELYKQCIHFVDLASHLADSKFTLELERALETFLLSSYLECLDRLQKYERFRWHYEFPEAFLNYLKVQEKPGLYHHHATRYMEHIMSSIKNPQEGDNFHLMSTEWFVLQEPLTSQRIDFPRARWRGLCSTLFEFDPDTDMQCDDKHYDLLGDIGDTEPIQSHRLTRVALSCMGYLRRWEPNTPDPQDQLHAWAIKSKWSPWIKKRRLRFTAARRRKKLFCDDEWVPHSISRSLRQPRQELKPTGSEEIYTLKAHVMHIWSLNLLYRTLIKAKKSDELTKALLKPIIPSSVALLFPRRVKRVRKAVEAYLKRAG